MDKTYSKDWYIENFNIMEDSLNGESKSPFHKIRKDAIATFAQMGFPTVKHEDWKYTSIASLFNFKFVPSDNIKLNKKDIEQFLIKRLKVNLLVFVNGNYSEKLSNIRKISINNDKIITIDSLSNVIKSHPEILSEHFAKYTKTDNGFIALNTAFAQDGFVIIITDNVNIKEPIHILNIAGDSDKHILSQPRNLVITGKNSSVKIIETYHSISDNANFSNVVTEVVTGENSHAELFKIQDENMNSFHINRTQVEQKKNSTFISYSISLGNALTRNDINVVLNDENITANLYGLY